MGKEFARLDQKNVGYSKAFYHVLFNFDRKETNYPKTVELTLDDPDTELHYTLDGTCPTRHSPLYKSALSVNKGDYIRARGFKQTGEAVGIEVEKRFK